MANLYGYLASDRPGTVTRASARRIMAQLQTWEDRLTLTLERNGEFELWREPARRISKGVLWLTWRSMRGT